MKLLISWGVFFIVGIALASLAVLNLGEVVLRWEQWELTTSLGLILALFVIGLVLFYWLVRLWVGIWNLPTVWHKRRQLKRYQQAQSSLSKGLVAQELADWAQAEKQLIATAKLSDNGVMHYLAAAKMADAQQATARRDQYLQQARQRYPDEDITIGLVEARLLASQQPETALVILAELQRLHPKHPVVLQDYWQLLATHQRVGLMLKYWPLYKKYAGLSRQQMYAAEQGLLLLQIQQADTYEQLDQLWTSLAKRTQLQPVVLTEYVKKSLDFRQQHDLAGLIEKALKKQWDESLVYWYGRIEFGPAFDRFKRAQGWLANHPESAVLLLTLGRLACQSQLWGQAHHFLNQSLALQPELETYHALAHCYEAEGEDTQAALIYKQALAQLPYSAQY
ncbi:heme biosynthesis HemY N-terminal domain-containing protein [Thiomicrospira sp. ALE5]|uniref:heme biosynthesis HemY N-terminal domain-containing protein n=1 Tax=Thiomicrospira sp. ALE5 TaxID=748650 RepID=UPI0008E5A1B6|nr:heme biosynthesis HemY N-terminal domain-containing protein [Thiomicrospira sp. ALE5]SFR56383.1 HemY protein [Thiomicrospira sp. ALE5]